MRSLEPFVPQPTRVPHRSRQKTTLFAGGNEVDVRKSGAANPRASQQPAKTTLFAGGTEADVRKSGAADFCQINQ
ncbi:MAG TPA: hypothetical protein VJQ47_01585 [Steroidobacteraceae bacterium]|nr:hypothetical protein [Steroidobacteraceae bacterium]